MDSLTGKGNPSGLRGLLTAAFNLERCNYNRIRGANPVLRMVPENHRVREGQDESACTSIFGINFFGINFLELLALAF